MTADLCDDPLMEKDLTSSDACNLVYLYAVQPCSMTAAPASCMRQPSALVEDMSIPRGTPSPF